MSFLIHFVPFYSISFKLTISQKKHGESPWRSWRYLICIITRGLCSYNARLFIDDVTAIAVSYWRRREFPNYARLHRGRMLNHTLSIWDIWFKYRIDNVHFFLFIHVVIHFFFCWWAVHELCDCRINVFISHLSAWFTTPNYMWWWHDRWEYRLAQVSFQWCHVADIMRGGQS